MTNGRKEERSGILKRRYMIQILEGQRPIQNSTVTLGEIMQSAGYITAIVGKWGLGAPLTEGIPNKNGFDFFYGYNCQRQAHQLYPKHLWKNEEKGLVG